MATENENQNMSSLSTEATTSSQKNTIITCGTCDAVINDDDTKLICTNKQCGTVTCNTCIKLMLKVMFGQPLLNYPLSCGACQQSFDIIQIEQILAKQERYEQFIACMY
jgi:hypothetical protein